MSEEPHLQANQTAVGGDKLGHHRTLISPLDIIHTVPLPSLIECSLFGSTSHRSHTLKLTLSIETASWKRLIASYESIESHGLAIETTQPNQKEKKTLLWKEQRTLVGKDRHLWAEQNRGRTTWPREQYN
ncbi:uncharacterized protein PGTG_10835 [Puccinia graminis f. sp. tritici CRL 75-36-700-3]|uniref:Uncharacterized protein n=1 Tax=Puccinia graminis f. sp. tritici (strain CRL 75-36-700-3 / race SCCL) TaxID=418459 RepID=E3KK51_PUCGT|nr:uncharacterized protein PGTG_10835 [Puccinia graminis f. sp. tritici CRL 75-36-700-3]EFP84676.2 hypothetical protein PGTG_10835 [Puccinia graminis f. sp. tritici CRL 75-36-700-3]